MSREFTNQKRAIILGLVSLVVADIGLAVYSSNLGSASHLQQDLMAVTRSRDLLKADIKRARDIRQGIPGTQKDCERFEHSLFPENTGYSSVSSELNTVANKAGLQMEGFNFRAVDVKGRPLIEVGIDATVEGTYVNVVHFLNGLQRSENMYSVNSLTLTSNTQGQGPRGVVRVVLHMKTYFRTV
jgi:Tfp pilus assembly protein PilO